MLKYIRRSTVVLAVIVSCSITAMSQAPIPIDSVSKQVDLGEVVIQSKAIAEKNEIGMKEIEKNEKQTLSEAIPLLPGAITTMGGKNDMVYIRGFNQRQVQLYYDGVPIYIPYDGYLDLGMLMATDIGKISVTSGGVESLLYGPNALGGAINVVTSRPKQGLSLNAKAGTFTNGNYSGLLSAAYATQKYYVKTAYTAVDQNDYRLSENYSPTSKYEDGGDLDNSYKNLHQFSAKIGWTPAEGHEYAFSYVKHSGEKGIPPYLGTNGTARFWRFPIYDKESFYFLSNSRLMSSLNLKTRVYYDKLNNSLVSYDDNTYTTITKKYAFTSYYDDYSTGAIGTLSYDHANNMLVLDAQYKYDNHKEHNVGTPIAEMSDQTAAVSLYDSYTVGKFLINGGVSLDYMESKKAEYLTSTNTIDSYPVNDNTSINGGLSLTYHLNATNWIRGGVAKKTRFPTMKDRYSLRFGSSIANPDLNEELSYNYTMDYAGDYLDKRLHFEMGAYYSHLKDAILEVYGVVASNPQIYQLQNVGDAEYFGTDVTVAYKILNPLTAQVNYAYIKRNNLESPEVKFTDVPENSFRASLNYKFKNSSYLNLNCECYSDRYSTSTGIQVGGYSLINFKGSWCVYKDMVRVEGGVNNIPDKNYQQKEGYPMPGRNYYASLVFSM